VAAGRDAKPGAERRSGKQAAGTRAPWRYWPVSNPGCQHCRRCGLFHTSDERHHSPRPRATIVHQGRVNGCAGVGRHRPRGRKNGLRTRTLGDISSPH
jgi:hypothetical protein